MTSMRQKLKYEAAIAVVTGERFKRVRSRFRLRANTSNPLYLEHGARESGKKTPFPMTDPTVVKSSDDGRDLFL